MYAYLSLFPESKQNMSLAHWRTWNLKLLFRILEKMPSRVAFPSVFQRGPRLVGFQYLATPQMMSHPSALSPVVL